MNNSLDSGLYWHPLKRIGFRFIFIFFTLIILFLCYPAFPFYFLKPVIDEPLHNWIPWVGKHILNLSYDITIFSNGSGDTTYDYVKLLCIFIISIVSTLIWSLLDRKRINYTILYYWLTVGIRFYVALMLIDYGLYKILKVQFPSPGIYRLTSTYGESSPLGLAWAFFGLSYGYNLFMGIAELAAILLFFRRTMTFGAIITLMTTAQVMAINYFFDVGVKIFSTCLFAMTVFLLSNDTIRLWKFFFTGKLVSLPVIPAPEIKNKLLLISKNAIKYLLIGSAIIYGAINIWGYKKYELPYQQIYGFYNVDTFILGHDTLSPLTSIYIRWNKLLIEKNGNATVKFMNDSSAFFWTKLDTLKKTIYFGLLPDFNMQLSFEYKLTYPDGFHLIGLDSYYPVSVIMTRKQVKDNLTTRGFHWISENPYNR